MIDGPVIGVSLAGVRVGGDSGRMLGWGEVRAVTGAFEPEAQMFMPVARDVWRARTRLARGDLPMAAPLFAELFDRYARDGEGPTAQTVATGHARCLIALGYPTDAFEPWLRSEEVRDTTRRSNENAPDEDARSAGGLGLGPGAGRAASAGPDESSALRDGLRGLAPRLPPIVLDTPATRAAVASLEREGDAPGNTRAEVLRAIYLHALRFEADALSQRDRAPALTAPLANDPGVIFARDIVLARTGDKAAREAARDRLVEDLTTNAGTWEEAWRRAAIGRSLLLEDDDVSRGQALVHLAHLPARFSTAQPGLASVALAVMSAELARLGRAEEARAMRDLLADHAHDSAAFAGTGNRDGAQSTDAQHALAWLDAQILRLEPDAAPRHTRMTSPDPTTSTEP